MQLRKRPIAPHIITKKKKPGRSRRRPTERFQQTHAARLLATARQTQVSQTSSSRLMQLPSEVRNKIYDFVVQLSEPKPQFKYHNEPHCEKFQYRNQWFDHGYPVPADLARSRTAPRPPHLRPKWEFTPLYQLQRTCKEVFLETRGYGIGKELATRIEFYVFAARGKLDLRAANFVDDLEALYSGEITRWHWEAKADHYTETLRDVEEIKFHMIPYWWVTRIHKHYQEYEHLDLDIYALSKDHRYVYHATGKMRIDTKYTKALYSPELGIDNDWHHPAGKELVLEKCVRDEFHEGKEWMFELSLTKE